MSADLILDSQYCGGTHHRAAVYLRKSRTLQQYSFENQMQTISAYARAKSIAIVRTYSDVGRSGLSLRGRDGLRQLICDVLSGVPGFDIILVYDLSRWGRFQDIDQSAHLEFICRQAGVTVEYCAEHFRNDGSLVSTILKGLKRTMAAEYSRELSARVFRGKSRLLRKGYHQGGPAGFALRRVLVGRDGKRKGLMKPGEHKSFQDDRVILVPGPQQEVAAVREVFRRFAEEGHSATQLAAWLNQRGFRNSYGGVWTNDTINDLLRRERYIGHLVLNRTSGTLQSPVTANPSTKWIRAAKAIAPIVDQQIFESVQERLRRGRQYSREDLLNYLTAVWCTTGQLTITALQGVACVPCPWTFRHAFGTLENAFRLVGYRQTHLYRYKRVAKKIAIGASPTRVPTGTLAH